MTTSYSWLPSLVLLEDAGGDWREYVERVYAHFYNDFVTSRPSFGKRRCTYAVEPKHDRKPAFFWHLISEGRVEEERTPDLRRCERIRWPKPVIERSPESGVVTWHTRRGKHRRLMIALDDFSYVAVLEDRNTYLIAITAFCVDTDHRREKLRKESRDAI